MDDQLSVLIVDRSEETREVLQIMLERHGVRTLSAAKAKRGVELFQQHHPDLVVLDLETDDSAAEAFSSFGRGGAQATEQDNADLPRLVLLGSARRQGNCLPGGEFLAKPYHYGQLIRKIEELLSNTRESASCRRCSSSAEPIKDAASS